MENIQKEITFFFFLRIRFVSFPFASFLYFWELPSVIRMEALSESEIADAILVRPLPKVLFQDIYISLWKEMRSRNFRSMNFLQIWYKDSFRVLDVNFNKRSGAHRVQFQIFYYNTSSVTRWGIKFHAPVQITRLALASILGPFGVHLLKFTLDTYPGPLMDCLGFLEFPVRICDALHITTHTRISLLY